MNSFFISGNINLENNYTFENFISQFQKFTDQLLVIENNQVLKILNNEKELPNDLIFEYKVKKNVLTEYYFRDKESNNLYCVFGRDKALKLFPRLDYVDKKSVSEENIITEEKLLKTIITPEFITIFDKGLKITFPNPNYEIEIESYKSQ